MSFVKRGVRRVGWRVSPYLVAALQEMRDHRRELAEVKRSLAELRAEVDEARADSRRIAELTDVLVERLAALDADADRED